MEDPGFDPTDFSQFDAVQLQQKCSDLEWIIFKRNVGPGGDGKHTYGATEIRNKAQRVIDGEFRRGRGANP